MDRCERDCEVERIGKHTWCAELIRNRVSRIASGRSAPLELTACPPTRVLVLCREIDYTLDNAGFSPEERYVSDGIGASARSRDLKVTPTSPRSFGHYPDGFSFLWTDTVNPDALVGIDAILWRSDHANSLPNPLIWIVSLAVICCTL